MNPLLKAIVAEPWAIVPSSLHQIAAIAMRHGGAGMELAAKGEPEFQKRDYLAMAGPGAQKLAGTNRTFLIDGVAVMPVTGPIFPRANMMTEMSGATSATMMQADFRAAMANADVGAIMLLIDSPGGQVSGIHAFAEIVAAGAKTKPVTSYVSGTGASAAYWIATAAGEIILDPTAIVGSIGVIAGVPVQVAPDANGEIWLDIVSSNAPNKRPDPMTEEGMAEMLATLDALEKVFVSAVAKGRKISAAKVVSDFGAGGVKVGADAVTAGMADRIQSYDGALGVLRKNVANKRKLASIKR